MGTGLGGRTPVPLRVAVAAGGVVLLLALLGRAVGVPASLFGEGDADRRPNLVLIVTDDQRRDTMGAMPNVQRLLAAHGITFVNAFVTTPLCCPSRASILTGQYARRHGVLDNQPPLGGAPAFDDRFTVATALQAAGYETALVGKYLNGYMHLGPEHVPFGWDHWNAVVQESDHAYTDYTLSENGVTVEYGRRPEDYSTTVLGEKAVGFVGSARRPFFLYFAPVAPHPPSTPAPEDDGRFEDVEPVPPVSYNEPDDADKPWAGNLLTFNDEDAERLQSVRRDMLESLLSVDRVVGDLVRAVERRGELDDTVIAFTSDNGYFLGEHRLEGKGWPYEESIHVPLVVRVPDVAAPGRTDRHLVLNLDLAPTFAELGGGELGAEADGRSLVPLLRGARPPWRSDFLVEYRAPVPPPFEAVRTERYVYVEYDNGWRELYDLRADPYQLENLVADGQRREIRTELALRLDELRRSIP